MAMVLATAGLAMRTLALANLVGNNSVELVAMDLVAAHATTSQGRLAHGHRKAQQLETVLCMSCWWRLPLALHILCPRPIGNGCDCSVQARKLFSENKAQIFFLHGDSTERW